MANLPTQMLPSVSEVDAIKQQLKLLGHSLPTEVIVRFLQDNSELLTACQNPSYGSSSSRLFDTSLKHAPPRASTQSNVTAATQGAQDPPSIQFTPESTHHIGPITPQLDVTWASQNPGDLLLDRPFQVRSFCLRQACHWMLLMSTVKSRSNTFSSQRQTTCFTSERAQSQFGSGSATQAAVVRKDASDQLRCTRDDL